MGANKDCNKFRRNLIRNKTKALTNTKLSHRSGSEQSMAKNMLPE